MQHRHNIYLYLYVCMRLVLPCDSPKVWIIGSTRRDFPRQSFERVSQIRHCVHITLSGSHKFQTSLSKRLPQRNERREARTCTRRATHVLQLSRIVHRGTKLPLFNKSPTFLRRDIFPSTVSPVSNLHPPVHDFVRPRNAWHWVSVSTSGRSSRRLQTLIYSP